MDEILDIKEELLSEDSHDDIDPKTDNIGCIKPGKEKCFLVEPKLEVEQAEDLQRAVSEQVVKRDDSTSVKDVEFVFVKCEREDQEQLCGVKEALQNIKKSVPESDLLQEQKPPGGNDFSMVHSLSHKRKENSIQTADNCSDLRGKISNGFLQEYHDEKNIADQFENSSICSSLGAKSNSLQDTELQSTHLSCTNCNKTFRQRSSLNRHLKRHGKNPVSYTCDACNKTFTRIHSLALHKTIHSGDRPHSCSICGKAFSYVSALKLHMVSHTSERPYSCSLCLRTFTQRSNLKKHMIRHASQGLYLCTKCKKKFTCVANLRLHKCGHGNEQMHICNICNRQFSRLSNLSRHLAIHGEERPYSCSTCNNTFRNRTNLADHMLVHTGIRSYSCEHCERKFAHRSNLRKHLHIHERK